jgi:broad specificity phosphatase PhoE
MPWQEQREHGDDKVRTEAKIEIREEVREWDYGEYEGLRSKEIQEMRKQEGQSEWDIWRDGCPGGEYVLYPLRGRIRGEC